MNLPDPRWRRRKTARPTEIVAAALEVFAEKGYAGARLDEIAARAGISKGALYLYFETKEELFRAVVREAVAPNIEAARALAEGFPGSFAQLVPLLLGRVAQIATSSRAPAVAKMVIGESRNFPDLARIWHDTVVSQAIGLISGLVARAQANGEVVPGDPRLHALSIASPLVVGMLWREVFVPAGAEPIDIAALAAQHGQTVLHGLLVQPEAAA